jgi:nicotinamide mononucleotide transporter
MTLLLVLELISVFFNIAFLILFIKEQKHCWIYGIIGSLMGAFIFFSSHLYSEMILYFFYAAMGCYALYLWRVKTKDELPIRKMKLSIILGIVSIGFTAAVGIGYLMSKTNADKPFVDAISSVFGVIATFLEIYKYQISWVFWIVINVYSVIMYLTSDLFFYALQGVLYTFMSVYGLSVWRKKLAVA